MDNRNFEARVGALSVRDLVRRRTGDDSDVWHLALVQRDEVWDQVRMAYLLDSLLSGYPIGSLLVCRATGETRVIKIQDGQRIVEKADDEAWQLLDGQQRINALFSIFTAAADYGHFYLNMTTPRVPPSGPSTSARAKQQSLRYIQWRQAGDTDAEPITDREQHIDLSRWYDWTKATGGDAPTADGAFAGKNETLRILNAIDPDFADRLDKNDLETASHRLHRLLEIWREPTIPVQYVALGSPNDVLEIFTRVNRAGVAVAGQDLFFAAVKTFWSDAEQVLARVAQQLAPSGIADGRAAIVGRLEALRVIARLAARATDQADLVPLTVDRLSGERGSALIETMREIAADGSAPLRRMATTLNLIVASSKLGFGLYSVDPRLWDMVLGWAAVNTAVEDKEWLAESLPAIEAYLFGATAFHYPSILRDPFFRLAMNEALAAGAQREPFPTQRIAEVARTRFPDLREGRQRIRGSRAEGDRLWLADNNTSLFLSVFQRIPYMSQRDVFDWDHIFPSAQAGLMWSPGPSNRPRHHRHRHLVSSAGNLWGLDAATNREAQDRLPRKKFEHIQSKVAKGSDRIWPPSRWGLEQEEIEGFCEIGDELAAKAAARTDEAMGRFHKLVTGRALRIVDEAFRQVPSAEAFASDSDVVGADPRPAPPIIKQLEIESLVDTASGTLSESPEEGTLPEGRLERMLRIADERGSGPALRELVRLATSLGLQVRPYRWTITITPPKTKAQALIALSPKEREGGCVETWVAPAAFAAHFPGIAAERFEEALVGIRGASLDEAQLNDLGQSLQRLLGQHATQP